jgi:hypothetical protein
VHHPKYKVKENKNTRANFFSSETVQGVKTAGMKLQRSSLIPFVPQRILHQKQVVLVRLAAA